MNEEFKIDNFVNEAIQEAYKGQADFSSDQAIDFVRIFIQMLYDQDLLDATGNSMQTAYTALYLCELFKVLFIKGYNAQSQRLETIEKLNKAFDI